LRDKKRQDQDVADRAKALKEKIRKARKEAQKIRDRDRQRTGVCRSDACLAVRFRQELKPFDALVTLLQIEADLKYEIDRRPNNKLLEDLAFVLGQKRILLEAHPSIREQMKEEDLSVR